jgi:hypothetical protein
MSKLKAQNYSLKLKTPTKNTQVFHFFSFEFLVAVLSFEL